jgi:hypothetical protein
MVNKIKKKIVKKNQVTGWREGKKIKWRRRHDANAELAIFRSEAGFWKPGCGS